MNRTQSILVIAGTLIIGFLLGILASGQFMRMRMDRLRGMRTQEGFIERHHRILGLEEGQTQKVDSVLMVYHERIGTHSKEIRQIMREMKRDLSPYLTEEQLQKLKERPPGPRRRFMKKPKP